MSLVGLSARQGCNASDVHKSSKNHQSAEGVMIDAAAALCFFGLWFGILGFGFALMAGRWLSRRKG